MLKFKPYDLATIQLPTSTRRRTVEVLSYPTPDKTIMVRMVPGDATTLQEVPVADLEHRRWDRYCHVAEVACGFLFPEDMLRYDSAALCNPGRAEVTDLKDDEPVLIYRMDRTKTPQWTEARWRSFSAAIKPVAVFDLQLGTVSQAPARF